MLAQLFSRHAVDAVFAFATATTLFIMYLGWRQTRDPTRRDPIRHRVVVSSILATTVAAALLHSVYKAIAPTYLGASIQTVQNRAGNQRLIVLIHGWLGGAETWTSLSTLLASEPSSQLIDIVSLAYPTEQLDGADTIAVASNSLRAFLSERPQYKDIVLVAHSLGGTVALYFVVTHPIESVRVSRVLTLGTPHSGTDLARGAVDLVELSPKLLNKLRRGAPFLNDLYANWAAHVAQVGRPALHCLGSRDDEIVPLESATRPCDRQHAVSVDNLNHRALSQPTKVADPQYRFITTNAF